MIYNKRDSLNAIIPLLKLLCLTLIGLFLGHRKTQIIPKATFNLLSKLVFALFLPCLTFIHLGQSITVDNIRQWWLIPINVLVSTCVGLVLGVLVVIICRPPPQYSRFTIIMTAFGNTGNLPLAIVGSICHDEGNLFGPECKKKGVAYVSFAQWVSVILVYTVVYHMMEPPLETVEGDGKEEESKSVELSKSLFVEAEHCKTPLVATIDIPGGSEEAVGCLAARILQPPTIASFLAIMVGMIPQLKSIIFGSDAPLAVVSDSLEILAGAMVPSVMLILGGMLAEGPDDSKLGRHTTIGIVVARLLVLPLVGIGIVVCCDKLDFLVEGDEMYKLVALLQYTTPSAILLGAIASLRGYAVSESSALLFWQHFLALFSLSFYLVIYFNVLL